MARIISLLVLMENDEKNNWLSTLHDCEWVDVTCQEQQQQQLMPTQVKKNETEQQ